MPKISRSKLASQTWDALMTAFPDSACSLDYDLPERLSEADMIIVSKCPAYLDDNEKVLWANELGLKDYDPLTCKGIDKNGKEKLLFFTTIWYSSLQPIFEEADPRYAYSQKLILFSGIAKDTPLRMYLSDEHKIVKRFRFEDHHKYTKADINRIMRAVPKCRLRSDSFPQARRRSSRKPY